MNKSEAALREACILAEKMHYEDLLKKFDEQTVIKIPKGQYERIRKLINSQSIEQTSNLDINNKKTTLKRIKTVILIAAILIILLSISATAFSPLRDFFVKVYKDCSEIVFSITNKDDYLFAEYTYIPEGYKKEKDTQIKAANSQVLLYLDGNKRIRISTLKNKHSSTFIDTENAETGEVMINGFIGYYSITKTDAILVWSTGKYSHCISADLNGDVISIDTLVKIAQSRQRL